MPKANAEATFKRIEHLQGMILAGQPNTACLAYARHTWGVSRSQGYKLIKRAWQQIKNDIDESGIDRQELLSWSIQTLMAAAGQAMQQKNPGAVVSCIRQLDHMTGTGYNSHRGPLRSNTPLKCIPRSLEPRINSQAWSCSRSVVWSMSRPISTS